MFCFKQTCLTVYKAFLHALSYQLYDAESIKNRFREAVQYCRSNTIRGPGVPSRLLLAVGPRRNLAKIMKQTKSETSTIVFKKPM